MKNNKIKIKSFLFALAFISVFLVSCKPTIDSGNTGTKLYQINVSMYDGGFGTDWVKQLAKEYNAIIDNTDYEIKIIPEKRVANSILADMSSGSSDYQLYINAGNELIQGIYLDYFEDLSDILSAKVDDGKDVTVQDKIRDYDKWQSLYSKYGQGCYVLPYSSAMVGLIIDHQDFIDNEWYTFANEKDENILTAQGISYEKKDGKIIFVSSENATNYKKGDFILSSGKDGKFGTYDDGQPITEAEFLVMIEKICNSGVCPFIWGGGVSEYLNHIFTALFAQYEGEADYNTFYDYDSQGKKVKLFDGSEIAITLQNGYRVKEMEGLEKAYEFFKKYFDYFGNASGYVHPCCKNTAASQYDAQNNYLLGYRESTRNPKSAMLVDGIWFEQEATSMLNELDKVNRGKGDREYRFLLLPDMPGQAGDKTCFSICETGSISLPKDKNSVRLNLTKGFVKYFLRDESLRMITSTSGNILNYKYELTEEDKAKMTPFQKNAYEVFYDTENVKMVSTKIDNLVSPLAYASDRGVSNLFLPKINGIFAADALSASKDNDLSAILTGLKSAWSDQTWNEYIASAKKNGFYGE